MSSGPNADLHLEIAHVLFMDVVGFSNLLINDQREILGQLNELVRSTPHFREAEAAGKLVRLATGDGMALVFSNSAEAPVECALEIAEALKSHPEIQLRMGIHSGPVSAVTDVNDRSNVTGAGINMAQRVMDCGDAGHILLSRRVAEDLEQYRQWQSCLHDLGECEVKHGARLHVVNLYTDSVGNPAVPERIASQRKPRELGTQETTAARSVSKPRRWRGILVLAALLVLLIAGALLLQRRSVRPYTDRNAPSTAAQSIPEKSIAVLPFENLSDEKQNAYFADGVQDEILTNLARIADLRVISRSSVMHYKSGVERNLGEIGKTLGVAHVLEGSVQRANNRIRVNAQLIDVRTDAHLWAQTYDRDLADIFAIQSEIAKAIADQLQAKLSPGEKAAIEQKPTNDLVAYDLYVRAKALAELGTPTFSAQVRSNLLQAAGLLEQAIARDSSFFLAYCQLAEVNDRLYFFGSDHTPARLALADEAVAAAKRLRPDSGETHLGLGRHLYMGYRDYDRARSELALARRVLPNDPWAAAYIGFMDRRQGRWEEHIHNLNRALELDPRNLFMLQEFSVSYLVLRRYPEMAALLDHTIALAPEDPTLRVARASVEFHSRGDTQPLHTTIDAILAQNPSAAGAVAIQWLILAVCERDSSAAARAVTNIPTDGISTENTWFPRGWFEGIAARARGDSAAAQAAFATAREQIASLVRDQPNYGEPLCVLGMVDAGLSRKGEAIEEGRRAVELLPETTDALNGVNARRHLAMIYAWVGEKDRALEELSAVTKRPGYLSYGRLKLHPEWDPLRGDPRFEKIVASLAPKQ